MPRPAILLATAFLIIAAPAAAQSLDGWGGLKFGMSPQEARAVPGLVFGAFAAKDLMNQNNGAMASKKPASLYGADYKFDLFFNSFEHLIRIGLWRENITSQADCESNFLALLSGLEKTYGKFSPVYPQRKKNDQEQLPVLLEWKNGLGASGYQLATAFLPAETAYVWNARKLFGGRYVDAASVWSAAHDSDNAPCLTELEFRS